MRKLKSWFLAGGVSAVMAVTGLVAVTGLTGCKSSSGSQASTRPPDDGTITSEVKKRLASDPAYKFPEVGVKTFDRVVQLSGFAYSPDQRQRAEDVAKTVPGVAQVVNNISIKSTLTPTGQPHTQYYY
jgi:osmotically-inducible protein OsmY